MALGKDFAILFGGLDPPSSHTFHGNGKGWWEPEEEIRDGMKMGKIYPFVGKEG